MKRPSFQFYPHDWICDPGLRACSLEERAVWLELLCLMHDSPRRGVLLLPSGEPMNARDISKNLGLSFKKSTSIIRNIEARSVSSREVETGALISRRMIRDEYISQLRRDSGVKGGNPVLLNQKDKQKQKLDNQMTNQKPTPSSSPSSSPSKGNNTGKGNISSFSIDTFSVSENSGSEIPLPSAEKRAGRIDLAAEIFKASYQDKIGNPYEWLSGDFPQLAKLRKRLKLGSAETPNDWEIGIENYFASPFSEFSLKHFASKFDTFKNSRLDRYKTPVNHVNGGNGNGRNQKTDRTAEAAREVMRERYSENCGTDKCGTEQSNIRGVLGRIRKT